LAVCCRASDARVSPQSDRPAAYRAHRCRLYRGKLAPHPVIDLAQHQGCRLLGFAPMTGVACGCTAAPATSERKIASAIGRREEWPGWIAHVRFAISRKRRGLGASVALMIGQAKALPVQDGVSLHPSERVPAGWRPHGARSMGPHPRQAQKPERRQPPSRAERVDVSLLTDPRQLNILK
jgi:hypothetical protein